MRFLTGSHVELSEDGWTQNTKMEHCLFKWLAFTKGRDSSDELDR